MLDCNFVLRCVICLSLNGASVHPDHEALMEVDANYMLIVDNSQGILGQQLRDH
jgi:hypothetical protein